MFKKNYLISLIILNLFLIYSINAFNAVDFAVPASLQQCQCLKENNQDLVIARGYHSYGAIDTNCNQTLHNAK